MFIVTEYAALTICNKNFYRLKEFNAVQSTPCTCMILTVLCKILLILIEIKGVNRKSGKLEFGLYRQMAENGFAPPPPPAVIFAEQSKLRQIRDACTL